VDWEANANSPQLYAGDQGQNRSRLRSKILYKNLFKPGLRSDPADGGAYSALLVGSWTHNRSQPPTPKNPIPTQEPSLPKNPILTQEPIPTQEPHPYPRTPSLPKNPIPTHNPIPNQEPHPYPRTPPCQRTPSLPKNPIPTQEPHPYPITLPTQELSP